MTEGGSSSLWPSLAAPRITRVMLGDFRSYPLLDLAVSARLVAFTGENGAGKTNLLEAISLFAPGRGLRRADLSDMAREQGRGTFSISIALESKGDTLRLGTGFDPDIGPSTRLCRVDGETVGSAAAFADHLRLVWMTPTMDGLFAGPAGDRRRFLDRLVLAIDLEHSSRVSALERALRSRNKVLEADRPDAAWLDAIEREVAETGVAVSAARLETVNRLASLILETRDEMSPFPWGALMLEGVLEAELALRSAVDVEDHYRALLKDNRYRDKAAGRTLIGPNAADLRVHHGPKMIAAERASTGEQKALLIGIVLAHARLVAMMSGTAPIVLLDEVAAHLDPKRRAALFATLDALNAQVFMTGADTSAFGDLPSSSELFHVTQGRVERIAA